MGAVLAVLASGGLAWWLGASPDRGLKLGDTATLAKTDIPAVQTPSFASLEPNREQVARAFEQVRDIYAERGPAAVARFSADCAASLRSDPRVLDFCLAVDMYGRALQPSPGTPRNAEALAAAALPPGVDAKARVAAVQAMTGLAERPMRAQQPHQAAKPKAEDRPVRQARAPRKEPPSVRSAQGPCRFKSTPTERALCASPSLRTADRRMRAAYQEALSAGVSRRRLEREQARWRVQATALADSRSRLAAHYAQRTRELRAQAARAR